MRLSMKPTVQSKARQRGASSGVSELLLLPDGRILVHNLTPEFARLWRELNPDDPQILPRSTNQARHEDR